ncbi:MAG TPA: rhamnose ABC transporter substrate-binding protein [Stackebrandtia sp.]|uniref:rhamnose ABC transporter substrate-binding protein n=1 Tax=Stackebrandtia sp. TaxID=2023065 RepID=UPI002D410735|nr:rhamnose ABC transporter substrate-binding protein [Stackebrandtia sp.]HZE40130.1 rhamnose ABC transporter substrate-binding protein [Stackebrandtia sp.]
MALLNARGWRLAAVAGLALALATGTAACSNGSKGDYDIAFLPKNLGNPYFEASDNAAKKAVKDFGGSFKEVGPSEATADGQVTYINTLTQQSVGAIVLSANDTNALCDALHDARDAGIKVVTFDSDVDAKCRDVYVSASSPKLIARNQIDLIAEATGGKGDIAILSATANATNQNAWIADMKPYLKSKYPDMHLVDVVYGNDDDQTSYDKTEALLSKHPHLDGIVSPTTVGVAAAARYLSTSQFKGKVALTGLGTPNDMRKYVKDGTVTSFALWNPKDLGVLASYAAKALLDKDITGKNGDDFKAKGLSTKATKFTVGPKGVITLGKPFVFDKKNIDDFDF